MIRRLRARLLAGDGVLLLVMYQASGFEKVQHKDVLRLGRYARNQFVFAIRKEVLFDESLV